MIRWALAAAGASGLLAVAMGAFAAHALGPAIDTSLVDTAARYHFIHTLAIALTALAPAAGAARRWCAAACTAWIAGIAVFSGSLYALALSGASWPGALTPVGGVAFMLGWALLVVAARRDGNRD